MTLKRISFLQALLEFMGLGGRVHLAWISSAEARKFARVMADFTEHIRTKGPNPLKAPDLNHLQDTPDVMVSMPAYGDAGAGKTAK